MIRYSATAARRARVTTRRARVTTRRPPRATTCAPGTFYNASSDACEACEAGSWCSGGPPALQPRLCSRGSFCLASASEPTDCPAGQYLPVTGSDEVGDCIEAGGGSVGVELLRRAGSFLNRPEALV